jgi:streptogramin lyase
LYIADLGNGRIRAISPSGLITTLAGNGTQTGWIPDGTPALAASLSPMAMAFGPNGEMYVAAQSEVLKLGPDGTFTRVLGVESTPSPSNLGAGAPAAVDASADGANGLAFDSAGDLYVAGFDDKSILMVSPAGILSRIGSAYPRGSGGLVTAPDGSVLAMDELSLQRLSPQGMQTVVAFPRTIKSTYLGLTGFSPDGIAVGPDGSIYLDTFYGNGFADTSALSVISPQGVPSLLWQQEPAPARG